MIRPSLNSFVMNISLSKWRRCRKGRQRSVKCPTISRHFLSKMGVSISNIKFNFRRPHFFYQSVGGVISSFGTWGGTYILNTIHLSLGVVTTCLSLRSSLPHLRGSSFTPLSFRRQLAFPTFTFPHYYATTRQLSLIPVVTWAFLGP